MQTNTTEKPVINTTSKRIPKTTFFAKIDDSTTLDDFPIPLKWLEQKFSSMMPDFMCHLKVNATWEYHIFHNSTDENDGAKQIFTLTKLDENRLMLRPGSAHNYHLSPHLELRFTLGALRVLLEPKQLNADVYYAKILEIFKNPLPMIEFDVRLLRNRLRLFKDGYRLWSQRYKFDTL